MMQYLVLFLAATGFILASISMGIEYKKYRQHERMELISRCMLAYSERQREIDKLRDKNGWVYLPPGSPLAGPIPCK